MQKTKDIQRCGWRINQDSRCGLMQKTKDIQREKKKSVWQTVVV